MYYEVKQTKTNLQNKFHPSPHTTLYMCMRYVNAESLKRSAKGSKFKEDDSASPPLEIITLPLPPPSLPTSAKTYVNKGFHTVWFGARNSWHEASALASTASSSTLVRPLAQQAVQVLMGSSISDVSSHPNK